MEEISLKDIIAYLLSGGALLVSIFALVVSIWLPIHLAKRAEEKALQLKNRDKLPPFYRKVKEFIVHMNTPGEAYVSNAEYYLSNEAAELGLIDMQRALLALHRDMNKADELMDVDDEERNDKNGGIASSQRVDLSRQIQWRLGAIHDLAERENEGLFHPEMLRKRTLMDRFHRRFNG